MIFIWWNDPRKVVLFWKLESVFVVVKLVLKDEMMEGLILRYAVQEDLKFLLKLANDKECRNNSLNPQEITLEEHRTWFGEMLRSETQRLYILMDGDKPIGQGRLESRGETCRISYSVIPERRGCGYGKSLLQLLNNAAIKDFPECSSCFGEVLKENIASQKIFEELGYIAENQNDYFCYFKYIEKCKVDTEQKNRGGNIIIKQ